VFAEAAGAVCLNPFGCAPKTLDECVKQAVKEASTEYGTKVLVAQCRERFPTVTPDQCRAAGQQWAAWMRAYQGEFVMPDDSLRPACDRWFPGTFDDSMWASQALCQAERETRQANQRAAEALAAAEQGQTSRRSNSRTPKASSTSTRVRLLSGGGGSMDTYREAVCDRLHPAGQPTSRPGAAQ
jgi:hypothetical protein